MRAREFPNIPQELPTKKSIVFFAPRIHDNQRGWLSALNEAGFDVTYLVFGHTRNVAIPGFLPVEVPPSPITKLLRIFTKRDPNWTEEDFLRSTYLPSFFWLLAFFLRSAPDLFISRDRTRASLIAQWVANLAGVRKRFLYCQEPLGLEPPGAPTIISRRSPGWLQSLAIRFISVRTTRTLTPLVAQDHVARLQDPTQWSDSWGRHFIPFCFPFIGARPELDKSETLRIVVLSKFRPYKNLFLIPTALETVPLEVRRTLSILIAGEVQTKEESELCEKLSNQLSRLSGLSFSVRQNLPYDDSLALLAKGDILILPSISDLAPVAPLEAMAMGVVPLISQAAGTSTFIVNGQNGCTFNPSSAPALASLIVELSSDQGALLRMKKSALDTANTLFTPDAFLRAFDEATGPWVEKARG